MGAASAGAMTDVSNIAPAAARDRCRRGRTHRRSKCWARRCLGGRFPFRGRRWRSRGLPSRHRARGGEQRPFGYYRITRLADGRAVGGIGFKGQPDGGCVEIGYGLAPSARGNGYAAEAVVALLAMAADHGLSKVIADTALDNIASQRTLIRAGFRLVGTDGELHHYEALLDLPGMGRWRSAPQGTAPKHMGRCLRAVAGTPPTTKSEACDNRAYGRLPVREPCQLGRAGPAHVKSPDYAVDRFLEDPAFISDVVRFDLPLLGDIQGKRGVHLQCHIGTDTISLARLGAA